MLYPQNGDRIVAKDSVTSLHPVYIDRQSLSRSVQLSKVKLCWSSHMAILI